MNGDAITVAWDNRTYSSNQPLFITVTNQASKIDIYTFSSVTNTGAFTLPPVCILLLFVIFFTEHCVGE